MSKKGVTARSKVLVMRETRSAYLFLLPALTNGKKSACNTEKQAANSCPSVHIPMLHPLTPVPPDVLLNTPDIPLPAPRW